MAQGRNYSAWFDRVCPSSPIRFLVARGILPEQWRRIAMVAISLATIAILGGLYLYIFTGFTPRSIRISIMGTR